jgi:proteasome accessory factor B
MSDPKTERLLNLTMALLATRRYLTKIEIFQSVAGYSGAPEAMERMFERDKDDLRSLGIAIEVGNLDNYFEDELGYRIFPSSYGLDIGEITARELALLSIAAHSWSEGVLSKSSQSALRKLRSLGISLDTEDLAMGWARFENPQPNFDQFWQGLEERKTLQFNYSSATLAKRTVDAYGLTLWRGFWYLVGFDHDRREIRVFKLIRVADQVATVGKSGSYSIPSDFVISNYVKFFGAEDKHEARMLIRKDKAQILRSEGVVEPHDNDWDQITLTYEFQETFLRKLLWFGPDVQVLEPPSLIAAIVKRVMEVLA